MADDRKVRLASVGLGWWGSVLADAAKGAGAEIVGGFARGADSRKAFQAKHGGREFESYEDILRDAAIDGVLLATPHTTHSDLIVSAARAGKHVLVEKPLTLSVESAKRAIAAAKEAGTVLQVGHNKRRQPANRRLKALIDSGDLGEIMMIETHQSTPNALGFAPGYWRANDTESPLGGMTSLGVHMIDTITYLIGPVDRVFASSKRILKSPPIDHATTLVFEFAAGPLGYLGTSFVVPRTTSVTVRGTGGTAINDVDGHRFYMQAPGEQFPTEEPIEVIDTVADQLVEFVQSIKGESSPETGGSEGQEVVAVLEAAVSSQASGISKRVEEFR